MSVVLLYLFLMFEFIRKAAAVNFMLLNFLKISKILFLNISKEKLTFSCLVGSCYGQVVESFSKSLVKQS